ncbi:dynein regulatory complex subunit 2-like [Centruroides vittatus]|uniref:dynein regulatory complex subunit 2-like n=1 Tax=Centruroides vittatus TaxID=120091 RepID=UPI003510CB8B
MEASNTKPEDTRRKGLISEFLHLKLSRETDFRDQNEDTTNNILKQIFAKIHSEEIRRDGDFMIYFFNNLVDGQDNLYNLLQRYLEDAERLHSKVISYYYDVMDKIIDEIQQNQQKMCEDISDQRDEILKKFEKKNTEMKHRQNREKREIQGMIDSKLKEIENRRRESKVKCESTKRQISDKNEDQLKVAKGALTLEKERAWKQLISCYKTYENSTLDRRQRYKKLCERDEEDQRNIDIGKEKVAALTKNIAKLKLKMSIFSKKTQEKIRSLSEQRGKMQKKELRRKNSQKKFFEEGKKSVSILATRSNEVLKYLQSLIEKVEAILKIRILYEKLELMEEKLHPFYRNSEIEKKSKQTSDENISDKLILPNIEETNEYHSYDEFWKLYNKALIDCNVLEKELMSLNVENQRLRFSLKKYFSEIQVDRRVLQEAALSDLTMLVDEVKIAGDKLK